jgi:hypothetical protein
MSCGGRWFVNAAYVLAKWTLVWGGVTAAAGTGKLIKGTQQKNQGKADIQEPRETEEHQYHWACAYQWQGRSEAKVEV